MHVTQNLIYDLGAIVLLNKIRNGEEYPLVAFSDEHKTLEPLFNYMIQRGWLEAIGGENRYNILPDGLKYIDINDIKFDELNDIYYTFAYVDLEKGEFAYDYYLSRSSEFFHKLISQDRFEDMRLSVFRYRSMRHNEQIQQELKITSDPHLKEKLRKQLVNIDEALIFFVFMDFLQDGKVRVTGDGWEFDLVSGLFLEEIHNLIQSHTTLFHENLGYQDVDYTNGDPNSGEIISGIDVIEDINSKGIQLALMINENTSDEEDEEFEDEEEGEDVEVEVSYQIEVYEEAMFDGVYYEEYRDPYYVSPCWWY